ncbi:HAD family phosphatase [Apibacter raozihei]|uniref:HAD family hydrolase n=1 Tax=Apibacter TaxID=1778601 RepID=UPI000FE3A51D|nr:MULTISPECIES: HAD family phosphatase [Apibacter]
MAIKAVLFDMDGVVTDTETQYDTFFHSFIPKYNLPSDFMSKIKGVRWPDIVSNYFSHMSEKEITDLATIVSDFEKNDLEYRPIPGIHDFIKELKAEGFKIALVTSSMKFKANIALEKLGLKNTFDAEVTGDDIQKGKPAPDCYLLAAELVGCKPDECVVFEDSFAGIEAGKKAGMKVIALSTTNSEESLQSHTEKIIPDFENFHSNQL